MTVQAPSRVCRELARASRVLLVAGRGGEGEVLGCLEALRRGLESLGREVAVLCDQPVPEALVGLLPGLDCRGSEPPSGRYSAYLRVGEAGPEVGAGIRSADLEGTVQVELTGNPRISTLAEGTLELLEGLGVTMDRDMALALYVALTWATDSFQNSRVTPSVHACAARLVELGVPTDLVGRRLFREDSVEFLQTLGRVLRRLEVVQEGRVACSHLLRSDDPARTPTEQGLRLVAERVDLVQGAHVTVLFQELDNGRVRVNLRSRCLPPGSLVACLEGHADSLEASGVLEGPISAARERVLGDLAASQALRKNSWSSRGPGPADAEEGKRHAGSQPADSTLPPGGCRVLSWDRAAPPPLRTPLSEDGQGSPGG